MKLPASVNIATLNLSIHGLGIAVIALLWIFVFLGALMTAARLYTRKFLVKQMGHDDFWAAVSIIIYVVYAVLATIAVTKVLDNPPGFSLTVINNVFETVKFLLIATIVLTVVSFTTKAVVIFFMLRLVVMKWHRYILWFCLGANGVVVITTTILEMVRCKPIEKAWKPIVPGTCNVNMRAYGIATSVWSSFVDFLLAGLPWFTIWNLHMKRKDRLLISISLSLGVFAGITGIVRTYYAAVIEGPNPLVEICRVFIASGAEVFVTILCAAIPTLRPLYHKIRGQKTALRYELNDHGSSSQNKRSEKKKLNSSSMSGMQSCESQETVLPQQGQIYDGQGVRVIKETTLSYDGEEEATQWQQYPHHIPVPQPCGKF